MRSHVGGYHMRSNLRDYHMRSYVEGYHMRSNAGVYHMRSNVGGYHMRSNVGRKVITKIRIFRHATLRPIDTINAEWFSAFMDFYCFHRQVTSGCTVCTWKTSPPTVTRRRTSTATTPSTGSPTG